MTKAQDLKYFREWGAVTRTCKARGFPVPDRHALHVKALGYDKSHLEFTNDEFTEVLKVFWALSKPEELKPQLRQINMPRKVLLYRIQIDQVAELCAVMRCERVDAENYVAAVMLDKFGTQDFARLSEVRVPRGKFGYAKSQLDMLRDTLAARINDLRKEAGMSIHDMRTAAELKCPCARCKKAAGKPQTEAVTA